MGTIVWISDFPLRGSSFGNVSWELCRRIQNNKVYILALDYAGTSIAPEPGLDILPLTGVSQLEYYMRKLKPDKVVIYHSFYFLEKLVGVELPDETYGYIPVEGENLPANLIAYLTNFKQLMTTSKWSQEILRKQGLQSKVVYHGVDSTFFSPLNTPPPVKEFKWGYIGLNDVRKQIPRIIEAYSRLPRKTRGNLTIASKGDGHYNLLAVAQGFKVSPIWIEKKFHGIPMSRPNLLDFYHGLDSYVNCATEAFGLPNLEAAACVVPSIALDHGASKDIMGGGAMYVRMKDLLDTNVGQVGLADRDDLYHKMKVMLEVAPERERIKKLGLERAKMFTWEKALEQLLDAIGA